MEIATAFVIAYLAAKVIRLSMITGLEKTILRAFKSAGTVMADLFLEPEDMDKTTLESAAQTAARRIRTPDEHRKPENQATA